MISKFARNGQTYTAEYENDRLVRLKNETTGENIPPDTKTFRRLADGNRGNRLTLVENKGKKLTKTAPKKVTKARTKKRAA